MHALRRFIQVQMDARRWQARDLARNSGLSKQVVSKLLNDDREVLPQPPRPATVEKLATAFNVDQAVVMRVVVAALGADSRTEPTVVFEIAAASDEELLDELARRLATREAARPRVGGEHAARRSAPIAADQQLVQLPPPRTRDEVEADIAFYEGRLAALESRQRSTQSAARPQLEQTLTGLRAELARIDEWEQARGESGM